MRKNTRSLSKYKYFCSDSRNQGLGIKLSGKLLAQASRIYILSEEVAPNPER
jgi:hypothetical protein